MPCIPLGAANVSSSWSEFLGRVGDHVGDSPVTESSFSAREAAARQLFILFRSVWLQGIILFILFIFIVDLGHGSWMIVHFMGSLPSGQSPAKPAPAPVPGPGLGRTKDHTQVFAQRNSQKSQDK